MNPQQPSGNPNWDLYEVLDPSPALYGSLACIARSSRISTILDLQERQAERLFVIHAIISDHVPVGGNIEDILGRANYGSFFIENPPMPAYLHYGGNNAFYFDLVADNEKRLRAISIEVKTELPSNALILARTLANHFLDIQMHRQNLEGKWSWLPLVISRMDIYLSGDPIALAHQCVMPCTMSVILGQVAGWDYNSRFAPYDSLIREAITTTSPYYRLLCASRLFEGLKGRHGLRNYLFQKCRSYGVTAKMPSPSMIDMSMLKSLQMHGVIEDSPLNTEQFFDKHFRDQRNKVAHFFLNSDENFHDGLDVSDGRQYFNFSLAGSLLLHYAHKDYIEIRRFFQTHIQPKEIGDKILPTEKQRDRFTLSSSQLL